MGSKAFCACVCVCMQALMFWSGERQNVINTRALKLLFWKLSIFFVFVLFLSLMQAITPLRILDDLFHFRHFLYQSWNQKWWSVCMPMDELSYGVYVCVLFSYWPTKTVWKWVRLTTLPLWADKTFSFTFRSISRLAHSISKRCVCKVLFQRNFQQI